MLSRMQKWIQIIKALIKYPNKNLEFSFIGHVIFRVTGLQKFETDQNNAKFSQITWPLHAQQRTPKYTSVGP